MRKRPNDVEKLDQISQAINSDGKGNLTVGKNLGVDGKLTLKSLVSNTNPDGDITKELGGGGVYLYAVKITGMSHNPCTVIFNIITNHTGLLTNEAVGRSEKFTEEADRIAFFHKLEAIWPSDSATEGPYILATGTFGKDANIKDINYVRYNRLANILWIYKDEADGNHGSIGGGNTNSVLVQRIM